MNSIMNFLVLFLILSDVQFLLASDSITKNINIDLPGTERISKRSLSEDDVEDVATILNHSDKKRSIETDPPLIPVVKVKEDFIPNETSAPKQVFGNVYRVGRAKKVDGEDSDEDGDSSEHARLIRSTEVKTGDDLEDLDTAANIVFLPSFRKRSGFRRFRRSASQIAEGDLDYTTSMRHRRSDNKESVSQTVATANTLRQVNGCKDLNNQEEHLETAHSMVFKPSFKQRNGFQRSKRSLHQDKANVAVKAMNSQSQKDTDLNTDDEMVLKQSLNKRSELYRSKRLVKSNKDDNCDLEESDVIIFSPSSKRLRRTINEDDEVKGLDTADSMVFMPAIKRHDSFKRLKRSPIEQLTAFTIKGDSEDLDTAADMVFMPSFRRRNRFRKVKRSLNQEELGRNDDLNDLDTAANIVFMPSFRKRTGFRRFKRSLNEQDAISGPINKLDDLDTAASMVFMPSFRKRTGFRRLKRSLGEQGNEAGDKSDLEDLDTAANIVFMPSFRKRTGFRRFKRSLNQIDEISGPTNELNDLDTAASMVFMPSFKKRTGFRRFKRSSGQQENEPGYKSELEDLDTASNMPSFMPTFKEPTGFRRFKRTLNQKAEVSDPINDLEDLDTAHSMVFMPSFRKRSAFRRFKRSANKPEAEPGHFSDLEDLDTAASIVFMPSFKKRTGFRRFKRSSNQPNALSSNTNELGGTYANTNTRTSFSRSKRTPDLQVGVYKFKADLEDLDTAPSMVFMPSFKKHSESRRFKRSPCQQSATETSDDPEDLDTAAFIED